eukprot:14956671-Ditylum_brightwellii.AAC.1
MPHMIGVGDTIVGLLVVDLHYDQIAVVVYSVRDDKCDEFICCLETSDGTVCYSAVEGLIQAFMEA